MVHSEGRLVLSLALCYFIFVVFRPFSKREPILVLFVRLFDLRLFGFFLFPHPLGVWEGLRLVIVALPGLFSSNLFFLRFSLLV